MMFWCVILAVVIVSGIGGCLYAIITHILKNHDKERLSQVTIEYAHISKKYRSECLGQSND